MMNRRALLATVLAAGLPPAFVRPTSLMSLWLPKPEIISIGSDWTIEDFFPTAAKEAWEFLTVTKKNGRIQNWINGLPVTSLSPGQQAAANTLLRRVLVRPESYDSHLII